MIVYISVIDQHRRLGDQFIGAYVFELPYEPLEHDGQIDARVIIGDPPPEDLPMWRELGGRILKKKDIPNPVRSDGTPL